MIDKSTDTYNVRLDKEWKLAGLLGTALLTGAILFAPASKENLSEDSQPVTQQSSDGPQNKL